MITFEACVLFPLITFQDFCFLITDYAVLFLIHANAIQIDDEEPQTTILVVHIEKQCFLIRIISILFAKAD